MDDTAPTYVEWLKSLRTLTQEQVDHAARAHDRDDATAQERIEDRAHHCAGISAH